MGEKQMKKSKIIIITIITILVFVAIAMYLWKRNENSYKIEKVTNIKYNLILENKKYGVIDEIGNIIVKPQYDIIQIPNPSKPVFICMHDYNVNLQQYEIDVFNENGQKILTEYEVRAKTVKNKSGYCIIKILFVSARTQRTEIHRKYK